jgi:hypothetical protein
MKHKSFAVLLLVIMLMASSGSALAQGSVPPNPPDDPRLLREGSFWFPNNGARAEVMKTSSSEPLPPVTNNHLETPMTADKGQIAAVTSPIVNGNFEQGQGVGWVEYSSNAYEVVVPYVPNSVTAHSGSWIAWLGDDNNEHTTLSQSNLNISSPATLSLWYWAASSDDCGYDYGYVKVNSSIVYTWNLCYTNNTYGWRLLTIDLNAYNGQTVTLSLEVQTDVGYPSALLIDDVSLYGTFADVAYGYWAENFIQRLYDAGITGGCSTSPQLYCTESQVSRDQMAVFLERGIHGSSYTPPAPGAGTGFADVGVTYWAAAWIKQLAAEGITGGCAAGIYCPGAAVTRAQMAVFLLRSKYGASYSPPAVGDSTGFGDVDPAYWAAAWIKQLVAEGITAGCGTATYCPETPVTRAQMAVFLVRTFNLP